MTANPLIIDRVVRLVAKYTCKSIGEISAESRLLYDLGIEGDDAIECLNAYCQAFGIDAQDIKVSSYFTSESDFFNPLWFLQSSRQARMVGKMPLTIMDLALAAQLRKWLW